MVYDDEEDVKQDDEDCLVIGLEEDILLSDGEDANGEKNANSPDINEARPSTSKESQDGLYRIFKAILLGRDDNLFYFRQLCYITSNYETYSGVIHSEI